MASIDRFMGGTRRKDIDTRKLYTFRIRAFSNPVEAIEAWRTRRRFGPDPLPERAQKLISDDAAGLVESGPGRPQVEDLYTSIQDDRRPD